MIQLKCPYNFKIENQHPQTESYQTLLSAELICSLIVQIGYFAEEKNLIVTEAKWRWGLSYEKKIINFSVLCFDCRAFSVCKKQKKTCKTLYKVANFIKVNQERLTRKFPLVYIRVIIIREKCVHFCLFLTIIFGILLSMNIGSQRVQLSSHGIQSWLPPYPC